jgi:hypothetical protein
MELQHFDGRSLTKSAVLSGFQLVNAIAPSDVIAVLNSGRISFVLIGAFGLAGWTRVARATEDVDVIVAARHHKKAVRLLLNAFPQLGAEEHEVVTRLRDRETQAVAIDVTKPNQPLYRVSFKNAELIRSGSQEYRVPTLEMALAMKFAPMISLMRSDDKKHTDAADFIRMVRSNPEIDLEKLAALGELVYPGGGKEIVEKVRQVRAGEKLNL